MYNPLDWYWVVSGSPTQIWSSARLDWVTIADQTYQAWQEQDGNRATIVRSQADLEQVMLDQYVPATLSNGIPVVCQDNEMLSGTYGADPSSLANISAIATGISAGQSLPSGQSTFNYRDINNNSHMFTASAFLAFGAAIEAFLYQTREAILSLIEGNEVTLPRREVRFSSGSPAPTPTPTPTPAG